MKKNRKVISIFACTTLLLSQVACNNVSSTTNSASPASSTPSETEIVAEASVTEASSQQTGMLEPYADIRSLFGEESIIEADQYNPDDIITYTFNEGTVIRGAEGVKDQIMENGKNPGLGIRKLHDEGITGKGINVAIIDQNLLLHHPEFDGKIAEYYDTGCDCAEGTGSMHAPAVTSILAGETIGVAPDVKVYFVAAPSWLGDSEYFAKGLNWIIDENKKLPEDEKIRVVSVSAGPSGQDSPFTKNTEMWDEAVLAAQKEGILVLDCRDDEETGIIVPAFYDPENPEDVSMCTGGFPSSTGRVKSTQIGVPTSYRTVAEEYTEGSPSYQYTGEGGLSWGIPYAAGVLALGWQVNPDLDKDEIVQILFDTCSTANDGSNIINPAAFIEAVQLKAEEK